MFGQEIQVFCHTENLIVPAWFMYFTAQVVPHLTPVQIDCKLKEQCFPMQPTDFFGSGAGLCHGSGRAFGAQTVGSTAVTVDSTTGQSMYISDVPQIVLEFGKNGTRDKTDSLVFPS